MASRAERLLALLQALRRRRRPVVAATLAEELGVSQRTLYRDVASLRAQGADVAGEAGVGYQLRPGFTLPPLMFTPDELDALALGARWVARNGDAELAEAAEQAMAKIAAVAPDEDGDFIDAPTQLPGVRREPAAGEAWLPEIRKAMRAERKLAIAYVDAKSAATRRVVWPVALGFLGEARVLAAWCETRADFRHFRVDRMRALEVLKDRPKVRRRVLLAEWRLKEQVDL
jgi:predicted DNA-binding transcriptional regulator YafY